jgi:hypothetical protein
MSEKTGDIVYTPRWVAMDMVEHFKPSGRVLEPCRGNGVFMEFLPPTADWCEIRDGRDFFEWHTPVDWTISNPPYSMTRNWFKHSYTIAANLLYLVPLRNVFSGFGFVKEIYAFGGIVEIRLYGTGGSIGFPMGNAVGAFHIKRGYMGSTQFSFANAAETAPIAARPLPVVEYELPPLDVNTSIAAALELPCLDDDEDEDGARRCG